MYKQLTPFQAPVIVIRPGPHLVTPTCMRYASTIRYRNGRGVVMISSKYVRIEIVFLTRVTLCFKKCWNPGRHRHEKKIGKINNTPGAYRRMSRYTTNGFSYRVLYLIMI